MRISDWSSDVCSSDLLQHFGRFSIFKQIGKPALAFGFTVVAPDWMLMMGLCNLTIRGVIRDGTNKIALAHMLNLRNNTPITKLDDRSEEHTSDLKSLMRI